MDSSKKDDSGVDSQHWIDGITNKTMWTKVWEKRKEEESKGGILLLPIKEVFPLRYDVPWSDGKYYGVSNGNCMFSKIYNGFQKKTPLSLYEQYEPCWPTKVLIDLDATGVEWDLKEAHERTKAFICVLILFYRQIRNISLTEEMLIVLDSSRLSKSVPLDQRKFSRHIILSYAPFYYKSMKCLETDMKKLKEFIIELRDNEDENAVLLFHWIKRNDKIPERECILDTSVYGNGRCMRIVWCTKIKQNRPLVFIQNGNQIKTIENISCGNTIIKKTKYNSSTFF